MTGLASGVRAVALAEGLGFAVAAPLIEKPEEGAGWVA